MNWRYIFIGVIFGCLGIYFLSCFKSGKYSHQNYKLMPAESIWIAPSLFIDQQHVGKDRALIIYGQDLIAHTSKYLGPKGSVAHITNGMNCQNCHLSAGRKPWGNNFGAVYSTYPKYRDRSGKVESIYKRVSDCMKRSLNGKAIDSNSIEFKAIYAYMKWLGKNVLKSEKPLGSGIQKIAFMNRAADPNKGKLVYMQQCTNCHGLNGEGQLAADKLEYIYPPLWGPNSYNDAAGLFRLSNFAGFVKNNMPFLTASYNTPVLTLEESWDVAAFVNSQPRPHKNQSTDWMMISKKPFDFPFGPYSDSFSTSQHKFGPFEPIVKFYKN